MISFTSGKVLEITDDGFLLQNIYGFQQKVITRVPGKELGLSLGDRVHVSGGPTGDVFASSSITKILPDNIEVEIATNIERLY